jgi:hypothetical protein
LPQGYIDLGTPGPNIAAADQTGRNIGNLTNALTSSFINITIAQFEIWHMTLSAVPLGAAAVINRNSRAFSYVQPYSGSEWDPSQPLTLRAGDEIDFLWNISATNPTSLPVVTAWFRYDPLLPINQTGL